MGLVFDGGGAVYFAGRTRERIQVALLVCLTLAGLVVLLAAIFPVREGSLATNAGAWLGRIVTAAVIYTAGELMGDWLLSRGFLLRLSSFWRVVVVTLLACGALALAVLIGGGFLHRL